jgi:hypothetical protein
VKPSVEQIQNLLALKRHEAPEEGYLEDFLVEFHRRRRTEAVRTTGLTATWARFSAWFSSLGAARWAYPVGMAYATALALLLALPKDDPSPQPPAVPVKNEVTPAKDDKAVEQLDALDLRPSSQGHTGEQEF